MSVRIGNDPWIDVESTTCVRFDDKGVFRDDESDFWFRWDDVISVAWGYEIHPYVIVDWDFWAFQTSDPTRTYWVYRWDDEAGWSAFNAEVGRRYPHEEVPAMKDWLDSEMCVRAYTVWPAERFGSPMYDTVKRHRWSWSGKLVYAGVG